MRKGDKWKKVFGVIVILAIIVSVFGGVVSAEDLSGGLKQNVDDAEIQTAVGNLSSEELINSSALDADSLHQVGSVYESSSNLGDQAASLAEAVVGAPYLLGAKGWNWNPSGGWLWSGGKFVDSDGSYPSIKGGYYYYKSGAPNNVAFGKGLDCSGLSFWTYNKAAGANKLIDASNPIYEEGASGQWTDNERLEQISKGDLKRGDLLFLIKGGGAKHVIMYVGNGYVVHAEGVIFNEIKKEELSTVEARYTSYGYTIGYGRVKAASGDKFNIGDIVRVTTNLNVRTGPGTGYPEITDPDYPGYAPAGTIGTVLSGPSSADSFIWWEVDYGPGLYSGWSVEDWLEKVDDNILPTVDAFSVTPASVTLGDTFTIPYTVSDTGGSGLKQVELWRKGTGVWEQIGDPISLVGEGDGPYSNSFYNAPTSIGTYEYGIHVVDNAGNLGLEPDPPGPIGVEVTLGCDGTDTSCGIYPNCENCNDHDGWYCNGNTREYRNFYCSGTSCTYTVTSSDNCNNYDGCSAYSNGCENRDYYCSGGSCVYTHSNRHTDYYDDWDYYCDGDTVRKHRPFHNYYCDGGTCTDHTSMEDDQLVENCNDHDGWVDTGNTKWVDVNDCQEKEQKEQKYRDYYCSGGACTYSVIGTPQWIDTGTTQNKPDGTICGCTARNTLKRCYGGVCTDTGICDSSICGADAACDGKEPGDSCGGGTCDSNCKCGGQAVVADYGVFRNGWWFIDKDGDCKTDRYIWFGTTGDVPVVGDFNGDGIQDYGIFRAGPYALWLIDTTGNQKANMCFWFGTTGDVPVVGDFKGDRSDDYGIFRDGEWFIDTTGNQKANMRFLFGTTGDVPVVGDFNGDGSDDYGIFRDDPHALWLIDTTGNHNLDLYFWYGTTGDVPVVGDFNGDGIDDYGVFRNGRWYIDTNFDRKADLKYLYGTTEDQPLVYGG